MLLNQCLVFPQDIADVSVQFPELIGDIQLPLFFEEGKFFSSVLRVGSAGIQLWTHYDVSDELAHVYIHSFICVTLHHVF